MNNNQKKKIKELCNKGFKTLKEPSLQPEIKNNLLYEVLNDIYRELFIRSK